MNERPTSIFEVYRWPGTTTEEFRAHYKKVHAQLGKKLPGLLWYETFFNEEATTTWQAQERPRPDAYVVMKWESEEAIEALRGTEEWRIAKDDDIGFASHSFSCRVARVTWIADSETVTEFVLGINRRWCATRCGRRRRPFRATSRSCTRRRGTRRSPLRSRRALGSPRRRSSSPLPAARW